MSKIVDERVVEMRFDNAQFERGVTTSISTLDKLKAKLNFKDSSKGLEEVGRAANQVRFDGMIDGINTVNARFSYLQGTIQHQLNNIVDSCVTAGKRIVSALTTRPVKDGFAEYETQMNAVQTILANTKKEGTNVKMVNAALDELNTYADKTIYNFTEMTRNIGTFTAAGVKLNTSVSAIKGIANLAAVSGSTSQQASTAMYQLSQALAAGTVKLMDWNSVVNAGMGGQVFQDALIRTSEHLQTGANAAIAAKGSFRESLQTGWLTTEVLTETLDMFATAADTQEEYEAAVEKFVSKGYAQEEAKQMADMAKTAGEAATKVKTFTQLTDTLKEALGSGWSTTWRLIIGDFDEAKSLWTSVNDVLSPIIEKMSNARNALLESALGKGFGDLSAKIKSCVAPAADAANTVKKVGTAISDLGAIVDDVILGKFGNGVDRFNALSEAGINYYEVQNKVNEKLNCTKRYTDEQIREQNRLLGITNDSTDATENQIDSTASLTEEQKKNLKELMKLNDEQLKAKGLTKEQIKALDELQSMSKKLGIPIDEFIDKLDRINGRWLLLEGFKNIGRAIAKVFSSISNAASEVFRALTPDDIFNVLAAFHKLTASLILNNENADKLKRTFKGLFAAIDIVRTILGGGFSIALRLVSTLLGNANMNILDLTARIGDAIVKLRDFLFNNELVNKGVDLLAKGFEKIGEVIGKVINLLVHNPVTEKITSIWDNIFGGVNKGESGGMISAIKQIGDTLDLSGDKANNFKSIMEGVKNSLSIGNWQWTATLSSNIKLVNSVLSLFGTNIADVIAKVADAITWFGNWSNMHLMFVNSGAKLSEVLATIIKGIHDCVEAFMQLEPVQKFIQNLRATLSKFFGDMSNGINSISIDSFCNQLSKAFEQLQSWINSLKNSEHLGRDIVRGIVHGLQSGVSDAIGGIISIVTAIKDTFCSLFGIHSPSTWAIEMAGWIVKGFAIGFERAIDTIRTVVTNICNFFKGIFEEIGFNKIENPMSAIGLKIEGSLDIIKKYFSNFADFLKRLDLKQLLTLIPVGLVLITTKKLFDIVKVFETGLQSVNGVLDALKGAIGKFGGLADAYSKQVKSKAFRNIAISIGILVASVVALTYVDQDKLFTAVGVITVLAGILTALAFTMSKMESASVSIEKSGLKIDGVKSSLIAIGASILMLAASIKLIGSMNQNEFTRGLEGMTAVVLGLTVLITAIGVVGKVGDLSSINNVGTMVLKISIAMLLLVKVCKLAADLKPEEMKKGAIFATGFTVFVMAMAGCYRLAGDNVNKLGSMILKLSVALGLMVGICKLIAYLKPEEMKKGAIFATGFIAFVGAIKLISQMFPNAQMQKFGVMMLSMTVAMGLMVGVCKLASKLNASEMKKGAIFATGFIVFVGALVKVTTIAKTQQIGKVAATILAVSIAMGAMAGLCILIGMISNDMWVKGIVAVTAFAAMVAIMVNSARNVGDIKGTIMMMAVSIGVMAAAVAALTFVDQDKLRNSTACLSALMAVFSVMESQASQIKKNSGTIGILAATVGVIAYALIELSKVPVKKSISAALGLSTVMLSLSVALGVISATGDLSNRAMVGIGVMTVALFGISTTIKLLSEIQNVDDAIKIATSLSIVLLAMSTAMLLLSNITENGTDISSLLKFAAVVGVLTLAISMLAPALQSVNTVSWDSLVKLSTVLMALSVGINSMKGALPGASAMLIVAAALRIFVPMLQLLGQMSVHEIGNSLLALAGAFGVIGIAGLLLGPITPLLVALAGAVAVLGVASLAFGAGAALLGNGLKQISKSGADAAKELIESIKIITIGILELIPQIVGALTQSIIALCDVLIQSAPKIATALVTLLTNVIQTLIQSKMNFISAVVDLAVEVLNGLTEKIPQLLAALSNFVVTLINELAAHMPEFIKAAVNLIRQIVQGVINNLDTIINGIIVPLINTLGTAISNVLHAIGPYIPDIVNGLTLITQAVCDMVTRVIEALAPVLPNIERIVSNICSVFTTLIRQIAPIIDSISKLIQQLGTSISTILLSLGISFINFGLALKTAFDGIADIVISVGEAVKTALDGISDVIISVGNSITAVFESIGDIIIAVGDSIKKVLDGIADIISSVGEASLNAGAGFEKLANGVETITALNLVDIGLSLAAVAEGLSSIAKQSDGLVSAGQGMQQILNKSQETSTAVNTISESITVMIMSLQSIGFAVSTSMSTLVSTITSASISITMLNTAMTTMMTTMSSTVISQSYVIIQAFNTMMTSVVAAITSRQSYFTTAGSTMMLGMSVGVNSGSAGVISAISSAMNSIVSSAKARVTAFTSVGRQTMMYLRTGIANGAPNVISQINMIISNIKNRIISRSAEFTQAGRVLVSSLSGGIRAGGAQVTSAISSVLQGCSSAIRSYYYSFSQAGSYLGLGLVSGINSMQSAVYNAGYRLGLQAVAGEKAGQKSHSPSKATRKAGRWLGEGLIIGIKEVASSVYRTCKTVGKTASDSITEALSIVNNIDEWGIDTDPSITIHPVLDMSNIKSGINYIDGLLNTDKTIALSTGSGSVISTASVVNQNGNNSDVINAIDKLRKELTNTKVGNTYNLNGITYDDGSNVSNAIETLVRAANIERRR